MTDAPFDVRLQVGTVTDAAPFPATDKPAMVKLWIDLGDETAQSAAQLGHRYEADELIGTQVVCATNLGTISIAGFTSEVLTVGVPDGDEQVVLLRPDDDVSPGATVF